MIVKIFMLKNFMLKSSWRIFISSHAAFIFILSHAVLEIFHACKFHSSKAYTKVICEFFPYW